MRQPQASHPYATAAIMAAALLAPSARADVVVTTYNTGFTDNAVIGIGSGSVTIGSGGYNYGSINVYNTYTGLNYYTPSNYVSYTSIASSGSIGSTGTGFTGGGLQQVGSSIGASQTFTLGDSHMFDQNANYVASGGSFKEPYTYPCGFSTCTGYNTYYYQNAVYAGATSTGEIAGPAQIGYLGISLGSGSSAEYGWLELETDGNDDGLVDVLASGYETVAGQSIAAGATQDAVVGEPATIGILAAGLLGLLGMRRKSAPASA